MGHQQGGFPLLPDDAVNIRRNRQPGLIVQGGERLIQQQDPGIRRQGADQGAALAHTAGQLPRPLIPEGPQAVALQQAPDPGLVFRRILPPDGQSQGHIVPDAPPGEQLVLLGHEAHLGRGAPQGLSVHGDLPAGQGLQPRQDGQQRGFAAAGGAHDAAELPLLHVQGHVPQGLHLPVRCLVHKGGVQEMYHHFRVFLL